MAGEKLPLYILSDVKTVRENSSSVNFPLHSSTSLPTGGEKQKAPNQCQSCELSQECTVIGAFFCALYSGNRVDSESVSEGYFASAPRPSSVRGEVANGGFAYGLVTRSQSDTNESRERGEVF